MRIMALAVAALLALLSGCGSGESGTTAPAAATPKPVYAPGEKAYRNTCSICHRLGLRGAPRLGDTEDWALRLAQGSETLYRRAIKGYMGSKGSMPPRGSNASLPDDEVRAAVDYMLRHSVPQPQGALESHVFSATGKQFTIRPPKDSRHE